MISKYLELKLQVITFLLVSQSNARFETFVSKLMYSEKSNEISCLILLEKSAGYFNSTKIFSESQYFKINLGCRSRPRALSLNLQVIKDIKTNNSGPEACSENIFQAQKYFAMIAFMTSRWFYESYQEPTCLLTTKACCHENA